MAFAVGPSPEVVLNGERLPPSTQVEISSGYCHSGPQHSVVVTDMHGSSRVLDPERDWLAIDGRLVFGTRREDAPPKPPEEPSLVAGKVLGFRMWALDGYRLMSANRALKGYWTIGVNQAECRHAQYREFMVNYRAPFPAAHDAPAPAHDCECGLYAWHAPPYADPSGFDGPRVYGAVLAWGRMEVHAAGFRAEYAEPVVFGYHPRQPYEDVKRIQAIVGEMDVPLVTLDALEAEARKHGQPIAESLRPEAQHGLGNFVSGGYAAQAYQALGGGFAMPVGGSAFAPLPSQWQTAFSPGSLVNPRPHGPPTIAVPRKSKGVKETLGHPGPPSYGKYRRHDLVADSRGQRWYCVKGGSPGSWEEA